LTSVSAFVIGDAPPPSSAQPSHSSSDFLPGPIYNLAQSGPLVAGKSVNEDPCFRLCVCVYIYIIKSTRILTAERCGRFHPKIFSV